MSNLVGHHGAKPEPGKERDEVPGIPNTPQIGVGRHSRGRRTPMSAANSTTGQPGNQFTTHP